MKFSTNNGSGESSAGGMKIVINHPHTDKTKEGQSVTDSQYRMVNYITITIVLENDSMGVGLISGV